MRQFEIGRNPFDLAPHPPPQTPQTPSVDADPETDTVYNMLHPANGDSGVGFQNGPDDIYPDCAVGSAHIQVVFEVHAGEFVEGDKVMSKFLSVSAYTLSASDAKAVGK
ncbi:hypothetical protein BDK51DRAFT_35253 [Blyttiomyces helicus]|uniref:Uncharacterized protein n=1 Tax=Blyttiomyces helicus TaxID=388810 RepID=A0A4P9WJN2_9FUNG|nr:hypothetical protein BDK51DRAFT_35253 [Blyttiomyces helicus]|eukprot:RKO92163.1 hypothetical protein BDK51DRAFT_35253 [Blyttiomyces helicus]